MWAFGRSWPCSSNRASAPPGSRNPTRVFCVQTGSPPCDQRNWDCALRLTRLVWCSGSKCGIRTADRQRFRPEGAVVQCLSADSVSEKGCCLRGCLCFCWKLRMLTDVLPEPQTEKLSLELKQGPATESRHSTFRIFQVQRRKSLTSSVGTNLCVSVLLKKRI